MAARKLSAAELSDFEEVPAAPPAAPRKLSAAELSDFEEVPDNVQLASAAGLPSDVPATPATPKAPVKPGFLERGFLSIGEGVGHLANVGAAQAGRLADIAMDPIGAAKHNWSPEGLAQHAAERKEALRGVDDVATLGYGQRIAARAGNALGDVERGTSLDETRHFSPDPLQGNINRGPSQVQAREQAMAPDVRPASSIASMFLPNGVAGGVEQVGRAGAAALRRVAPEVVAKALGYGARVPGIITGPAKAIGGYESVAPLSAGLSASAEGHRMEAAGEAAGDSGGLILSAGVGAAGEVAKRGVLNSEGAKAREFIEQHGNGAQVGFRTAGSGGVFDKELAGLPTNDRGIGIAGKLGAKAVLDPLEAAHAAEHGYGYREGPAVKREAAKNLTATTAKGERQYRIAQKAEGAEQAAVKSDSRMHADERAKSLLAEADERHNIEGSAPYADLQEQINASPAAREKVDITHVVKLLRASLKDLGTSHEARGKIREDLQLLEPFSDAPPPGVESQPPSPHLAGLLEARRSASGVAAENLDALIASEVARTAPPPNQAPVKYLVPHRQVNALRRNVMAQANIGKSDAPRGSDAPLRAAAHALKEIVDAGPYAPMNELYTRASNEREATRESLGLRGRLGNNRAAEELALKGRMVKSVNDPTALPQDAPDEASMAPFRDRLAAAAAAREGVGNRVTAAKDAAGAAKSAAEARVAKGSAAAVPDRELLGLTPNIGTRKTDVNQVKLALMRQAENTKTAGGNPADIEAFRAKHPELSLSLDLPALQTAKADLTYRFGGPKHGGFIDRHVLGAAGWPGALAAAAVGGTKGLAILGGSLAVANRKPIAGRVLYNPAKKIDVTAIGRMFGRAGAATLGQKMKAVIDARKEQDQQP